MGRIGREVIQGMIADGSHVARPADEDGAVRPMHKRSKKSRERRPGFAVNFPPGAGHGREVATCHRGPRLVVGGP